jgi:ribosomal protein S27AE
MTTRARSFEKVRRCARCGALAPKDERLSCAAILSNGLRCESIAFFRRKEAPMKR